LYYNYIIKHNTGINQSFTVEKMLNVETQGEKHNTIGTGYPFLHGYIVDCLRVIRVYLDSVLSINTISVFKRLYTDNYLCMNL